MPLVRGSVRPGSGQPRVSGHLCRDWSCQAEAQTQDHEGAFPPWHLSAVIPKNLLPALPCPPQNLSILQPLSQKLSSGHSGAVGHRPDWISLSLSSNGPMETATVEQGSGPGGPAPVPRGSWEWGPRTLRSNSGGFTLGRGWGRPGVCVCMYMFRC